MKYITMAFLIIAGALCSCVPANKDAARNLPLPPGAVQGGSLTNQKLRQDATVGVLAKLLASGHDMGGRHDIVPFVTAMPTGPAGSRRWTEKWYVKVKEDIIPVTIDFKESGANAADWSIRR